MCGAVQSAAREEERTLCLNQRDCGGNAAQWELTLRAGGENQFQGQHGNITFSRYKAAMSCVVRPCWSRRPARELQEKERDQGHVAMFPKDLTTWNDSRWQMYCVGMLKERRKLLTLLVLAWHQRFDFDATTNFNILGFDTTKPQQTTSSAMPHVCSKFCTISQKINGQEIYTSDSQMSQKHWKTTNLVHRNTNVRHSLSFTYSKLTCTVNPAEVMLKWTFS